MLYEIVDLSTVWIQFDGYESQLPFLKIGATIDFTTDAVPGKNFTGKINFIDPIMDPNTRTSTVRVVYPNKNGELKPDMFVSGVIQAGTKNKEAITIGLLQQQLIARLLGKGFKIALCPRVCGQDFKHLPRLHGCQ